MRWEVCRIGKEIAPNALFHFGTTEEQLVAHLAKQHSSVVAEGKEGDGDSDDHGHNGERAGDPVVVEQREILIEQRIIVLVCQEFYERLDAAVGELTGHHGEEGRKREGFCGRFDFGGEGNGETSDDNSRNAGCHCDVPTCKVHEEEARDVTAGGQKCTSPEGGTRGIADACEADASDGGKNAVVYDVVAEIEEVYHERMRCCVGDDKEERALYSFYQSEIRMAEAIEAQRRRSRAESPLRGLDHSDVKKEECDD